MLDALQTDVPAGPPVAIHGSAPAKPVLIAQRLLAKPCAPRAGDEIVVCAKPDDEQYRLRPLPTIERRSRTLSIELAPGVRVGFLGKGFGLKAEF